MTDIFDTAPCGIFSFNDEGVILQANDTLCRWLKAEKEELSGRKVNTIFTLSTLIFYQTHFYPLLKMQQSVDEIYLTLKTKDKQEIPVLVSACRIERADASENVCCCLTLYNRKNFEDEIIAARNKAEKALKENTDLAEAQARLQQQVALLDEQMFLLQQRNEELQELNHILSHDLQEPVRKLTLYSDLLLHPQHHLQPEALIKKIIRITRTLRDRQLGMERYTTIANAPLRFTNVAVAQAVSRARQQVLSEIPGILLDLQAEDLPEIRADSEQMFLLFYELLTNSVKFRSPQRPLQVRIESSVINRNLFRVLQDQYHYEDHHKITFADNGTGFHPKYEKQVFQLFKKIDPDVPGMGIGLTICQKIVNNHKGAISVKSREGEGTVFTLYLPATL